MHQAWVLRPPRPKLEAKPINQFMAPDPDQSPLIDADLANSFHAWTKSL
jgi:hypothetical protein